MTAALWGGTLQGPVIVMMGGDMARQKKVGTKRARGLCPRPRAGPWRGASNIALVSSGPFSALRPSGKRGCTIPDEVERTVEKVVAAVKTRFLLIHILRGLFKKPQQMPSTCFVNGMPHPRLLLSAFPSTMSQGCWATLASRRSNTYMDIIRPGKWRLRSGEGQTENRRVSPHA